MAAYRRDLDGVARRIAADAEVGVLHLEHLTKEAPATTLLLYAPSPVLAQRLWLTPLTSSPTGAFEDVLCATARRGVDVRLLINGQHVDKEVVRQASRRSYTKFLDAGIRIFEYNQPCCVPRCSWSMTAGPTSDLATSTTAPSISTLELNVAVADPGCVAELEKHFLEDLTVSEEIDPEAWHDRPRRTRLKEGATGWFASPCSNGG